MNEIFRTMLREMNREEHDFFRELIVRLNRKTIDEMTEEELKLNTDEVTARIQKVEKRALEILAKSKINPSCICCREKGSVIRTLIEMRENVLVCSECVEVMYDLLHPSSTQ